MGGNLLFSWFIKNKQFSDKGGLAGQITPFLLVVLVILLIAAMATINIGRVSLDKTCSANGADAGSLAAASAWASAFNLLTEMNYNHMFQDSDGNWYGMKTWFDVNYYTYGQLYVEADKYINEAIIDAVAASATAGAAAVASHIPPPCAVPWYLGIVVAVLDGTAATFCFEASQK